MKPVESVVRARIDLGCAGDCQCDLRWRVLQCLGQIRRDLQILHDPGDVVANGLQLCVQGCLDGRFMTLVAPRLSDVMDDDRAGHYRQRRQHPELESIEPQNDGVVEIDLPRLFSSRLTCTTPAKQHPA